MRDLRFRAWDKFNECFYYSHDYNHLADFFTWVKQCEDGGNDIVIQQHTGLKDTDGKEIWEGDIVKNKHTNKMVQVIWVSGLFNIQERWNGDFNSNPPISGVTKSVIDNIYKDYALLDQD